MSEEKSSGQALDEIAARIHVSKRLRDEIARLQIEMARQEKLAQHLAEDEFGEALAPSLLEHARSRQASEPIAEDIDARLREILSEGLPQAVKTPTPAPERAKDQGDGTEGSSGTRILAGAGAGSRRSEADLDDMSSMYGVDFPSKHKLVAAEIVEEARQNLKNGITEKDYDRYGHYVGVHTWRRLLYNAAIDHMSSDENFAIFSGSKTLKPASRLSPPRQDDEANAFPALKGLSRRLPQPTAVKTTLFDDETGTPPQSSDIGDEPEGFSDSSGMPQEMGDSLPDPDFDPDIEDEVSLDETTVPWDADQIFGDDDVEGEISQVDEDIDDTMPDFLRETGDPPEERTGGENVTPFVPRSGSTRR